MNAMSQLIFREATPEDYSRVDELVENAYTQAYGDLDVSWDKERTAVARAAYPQHIWVAQRPTGEIIATLSGRIFGERSVVDEDVQTPDHLMDLRLLAVDPSAQGEGVAARMMAHAETVARQTGFKGLLLETLKEWPGPQALYRKLGWREIATIEPPADNPEVPTLLVFTNEWE
ncbi:GNAT family N-acetyltransferase [Canibacter zhoujuaniae]|uniref:GNAT family N-acetyltransferase n=1 Tax=Canibacter zhoujuaniae TaxID=2708343 RepID=UPI0014203503|nr:GNAT family N-acetyltransferase [Canibacter zhoujuaniae]